MNTVIAGPGTDDAVLRRGDEDGQFPATGDALFKYDLIFIGEVSPKLFAAQDFEWLKEFVEVRGGGMVFIDGQRRSLLRLADTELGALLPVEWLVENDRFEAGVATADGQGSKESALNLAADEEQNRVSGRSFLRRILAIRN